LRTGGIESIRSVNHLRADETLILHDPLNGTHKFFMLEYRSRTNPVGTNSRYDRDVAGTGVVIWSVEHNAGKFPITRMTPDGMAYNTVYAMGAPALSRGGTMVWRSNTASPYLTWDDGFILSDWIRIHPFDPGDPMVTVEWLHAGQYWADFNHSGTELGNFGLPFASLAVALPSIPRGGILTIKPSATSERPRFTKPITLKAWTGPVIIGR
jgi:hypothetical protein